MEKFVVSARKYRPITFKSVVGQDVVTTTLKNAIANDQLAQAFLFCGPRGVGKTTCARILAKTINCVNINDDFEACDECESCRSFTDSASLNIYELDAASNNSVEDIRQLVDQVRIPPQSGEFKVYIIDEVHMLSNAAFNAFLKTLEEPPSYAKFILATTEKHKILPTILSRCQIFDFRRIEIKDITEHLVFVAEKEGIQYEKDALSIIAQKADGALRDALSIFDQIVNATDKNLSYKLVAENLNVLDYDYFFKLVNHILKKEIPAILLLINEILSRGFEGQHLLLGLGEHFRSLLISKDQSTLKLLECGDEVREKFKEQAKEFNTVLLVQSLDLIGKADQGYRQSQSKRLFLELNVLQIAALHFPESAGEKKKKLKLPPKIAEVLAAAAQVINQTKALSKATEVKVEQPVAESQITGKTNLVKSSGLRRSGTLSIKNYHNTQHVAKNIQEKAMGPKRTNPFGQQELDVAWKKFIQLHEKDEKVFTNAIAISSPKIMDAYQIVYEAHNELIVRDVQNITSLLLSLKDSLENDLITLKPVRVENVSHKHFYTDKDKYMKMVEDFPILGRLKTVLDLEIDY